MVVLIEGEGGGIEGSRVELAENRFSANSTIFSQFYSIQLTLFYSPLLPLFPMLNPNGS